MTDYPAADAMRELIKSLEELTKLAGVTINLVALQRQLQLKEQEFVQKVKDARPKPKLRIISTDRPYNHEEDDDGA